MGPPICCRVACPLGPWTSLCRLGSDPLGPWFSVCSLGPHPNRPLDQSLLSGTPPQQAPGPVSVVWDPTPTGPWIQRGAAGTDALIRNPRSSSKSHDARMKGKQTLAVAASSQPKEGGFTLQALEGRGTVALLPERTGTLRYTQFEQVLRVQCYFGVHPV